MRKSLYTQDMYHMTLFEHHKPLHQKEYLHHLLC